MFKIFIRSVFYFIYQFFFSQYFLISFIKSKKIIIFDKKNFKFFNQYVNNNNDLNTFRQIFIKEEYKFNKKINNHVNFIYGKILKQDKIPLIVDCGANICASANYFYKAYPKTNIIGIEPDQINFDICKKNNLDQKKIKIIKGAISSEKFMYSLERKNKDGRSSYIKLKDLENVQKGLPKTITIKDIMSNYQLEKYEPFIIKIDIEGHEKKFFEYNTEWIKYFKFIIIELHDWMLPNENISATFHKALEKNLSDYEIHNFGENTLVINNKLK